MKIAIFTAAVLVIAALLITPVCAALTNAQGNGGTSVSDHRAEIQTIVMTITNHDEKLESISECIGMDARLKAWLDAPRDEETGEPIYEDTSFLGRILAFFGISMIDTSTLYTQAEGEAVWDVYLQSYTANLNQVNIGGTA